MDQTWSGSSQAFVHQHCAFPTISRAPGKTLSYKTVKIFDDGSILKQGGWDNEESEKDVLTIWAILLRFYAVSDIVSFLSIAAIPEDLPKDLPKDAKSKGSSQCSRIHLCYNISDHVRLCDVKVALEKTYRPGEINATVNTGVAFSKSPYSDTAELADVLRDLSVEHHVCLDSFGCSLLA